MTSPVVTRKVNPHPTCSSTPTPIYTDVDMSIYYPYKVYSLIFSLIIFAFIIFAIIGSIIGGIILFIIATKKKDHLCPKCGRVFKYKKKLPSRCPLCLSRIEPPECP